MTKRRRMEPALVKELLPGVLKGMCRPGGGALVSVRRAWAEVVGPAVAARTRVAGLESGRVRVEVASAALKHDLATFRRAAILDDLKRRLPDQRIIAVSFRVGTIS